MLASKHFGGSEASNVGLAQVASVASADHGAHAFGSSGWEAVDYAGAAVIHANYGMDALNLHQDAIPQV